MRQNPEMKQFFAKIFNYSIEINLTAYERKNIDRLIVSVKIFYIFLFELKTKVIFTLVCV